MRPAQRTDWSVVYRSQRKHRRLDGSDVTVPVAAILGPQPNRLQILIRRCHRRQLGHDLRRDGRIGVRGFGDRVSAGAEDQHDWKQQDCLV